jgi:hypothetical protein
MEETMGKAMAVVGLLAGVVFLCPAAYAGELFQARLTGDQEVPPVATDTTGRFEILFANDLAAGEYTLRVESGLRLQQAHLHCGPAGSNGPVIVFLAGNHASGWDVDGKWVSNATVTNANITNTACGMTLEAIAEAARNGNVYVNVHSVARPAGLVRGQLLPAASN